MLANMSLLLPIEMAFFFCFHERNQEATWQLCKDMNGKNLVCHFEQSGSKAAVLISMASYTLRNPPPTLYHMNPIKINKEVKRKDVKYAPQSKTQDALFCYFLVTFSCFLYKNV
ncbi:Uncharacterized protein TCM_012071 [Theobroma cacao]|uniref:Uncharacterized protein n=1 Tax=Theobroma cacao TaxID=3641 RepID=A0A061FU63_THECC|nr:Uncharacterized protein TCM_012071 [Theobroma cacao]